MEPDIDLEALQRNIDESMDESEQDEEQIIDPDQETEEIVEEEQFDIDAALDGDEPVILEGKLTNEEAIEKAKERGWNEEGKDKFGHSVSAIEFLERTPLFHKMDLLRGDVNEQKKKIDKLIEQNKLIAQNAIKEQARKDEEHRKEREELLNQEILDRDDIEKLKAIDKKIEQNVVPEPAVSNEAIAAQYEVAKEDFVKEHDWYESDYKMTKAADKYGVDFATKYYEDNGELPEPEVTFKHVLTNIERDFPEQEKPQRQTRVAARGNRKVVNHKPNKKTISDLPADQQDVAKMVMEAAEISEAEYLKTYEW